MDGLPSSEPMKMTTCTVVVNWRYSCASPNSPSALRLAPAASAPDALRGSLEFREIQLPLCPMARLGPRLCSSPALPTASEPRASLSCPGHGGTRGCLVESWRTPGSRGSPHVSTSPAPAPGRRGGRRARLRPMPIPSWVPVSNHMKAARSEPAEHRPSLLPSGQRSQAHSAEIETLKEAFDGQEGRSRLLPPPSTSAPSTPEGRGIPRESPR